LVKDKDVIKNGEEANRHSGAQGDPIHIQAT
jgi:hypothetical protein